MAVTVRGVPVLSRASRSREVDQAGEQAVSTDQKCFTIARVDARKCGPSRVRAGKRMCLNGRRKSPKFAIVLNRGKADFERQLQIRTSRPLRSPDPRRRHSQRPCGFVPDQPAFRANFISQIRRIVATRRSNSMGFVSNSSHPAASALSRSPANACADRPTIGMSLFRACFLAAARLPSRP